MTRTTPLQRLLLATYRAAYAVARPVMFRSSAQAAHTRMLRWLGWLDERKRTHGLLAYVRQAAFTEVPVRVGGVDLPYPFILAAGLVKGMGFETEADACARAQSENIIPGWRSLPLLVGPVEFGTFTRWPRIGNPGVTVWRDTATQSTQNRVGLKNPGAKAAARFLGQQQQSLPPVFGINVAPSPGEQDLERARCEALESLEFFLDAGIRPSWVTLNISCPNTEDDPGSRQTEASAQSLVTGLSKRLTDAGIPLWVKVSPGLADEQYRVLLSVFADAGVQALVATNTLGRTSPDNAALVAGVGGGQLRHHALAAVRLLSTEIRHQGYALDLIGCGGIMDGASYRAFREAGAGAVQYWSALVYRGPLAAAVIGAEAS